MRVARKAARKQTAPAAAQQTIARRHCRRRLLVAGDLPRQAASQSHVAPLAPTAVGVAAQEASQARRVQAGRPAAVEDAEGEGDGRRNDSSVQMTRRRLKLRAASSAALIELQLSSAELANWAAAPVVAAVPLALRGRRETGRTSSRGRRAERLQRQKAARLNELHHHFVSPRRKFAESRPAEVLSLSLSLRATWRRLCAPLAERNLSSPPPLPPALRAPQGADCKQVRPRD